MRELLQYGKDISMFIPEGMEIRIKDKGLGIKMEMMKNYLLL